MKLPYLPFGYLILLMLLATAIGYAVHQHRLITALRQPHWTQEWLDRAPLQVQVTAGPDWVCIEGDGTDLPSYVQHEVDLTIHGYGGVRDGLPRSCWLLIYDPDQPELKQVNR